MNKFIDLRSDTVTKPTEEMRRAMAAAEVGDDVYEEDPTVNRLQEKAADIFGKESALLLPSGTMANLVAILTHTQAGDEVLVGNEAHVYYYEVGGLSAVAGVVPRLLPDSQGKFKVKDLENALRPENVHYPNPTLLCLENTHNRGGGVVLTAAELNQLTFKAKKAGLAVHLDGARIFNAAAALKTDVQELTREVDSVMFSLSKGLAAPMGSMLVGSNDFIKKARKKRKMVGGGLRQSGIIAAAGLVALETMVERLNEDHENAWRLAEGLAEVSGINVERPQTNLLFVDIEKLGMLPVHFVERLRAEGVLINPGGTRLRFVTHKDITKADIKQVIRVVSKIARS